MSEGKPLRFKGQRKPPVDPWNEWLPRQRKTCVTCGADLMPYHRRRIASGRMSGRPRRFCSIRCQMRFYRRMERTGVGYPDPRPVGDPREVERFKASMARGR